MTAQSTLDEARRMKYLREYGVLDTPSEQGLDELTALAAQICATPIALISLVDENRQWFKATFGLAMVESPRNTSFCSYALDKRELFIVPDAAQDERFAHATPSPRTSSKRRRWRSSIGSGSWRRSTPPARHSSARKTLR